jgi:hypothetical protein
MPLLEELQIKKVESDKPKGLRRTLSLVTVSLAGHLFDTHCFNKAIDACEQGGVQFRVLRWDLGMTNKSTSTVSLQIMSKNKTSLNTTMDSIEEIAENCGVKLF